MRKKLTLTIDESLIKKAKSYSKDNGTSLSRLVENSLITLIEGDTHRIQLSSKLKKIVGRVKLPDNFDEKKELDTRLIRF